MKSPIRNFTITSLALCALLAGVAQVRAANVQVAVDPGQTWIGFMNVFNLPADGGAFVFNGAWGTADLRAAFSGSTLTLSPNTNVYNPTDPFWVKPSGDGNKSMDANFYVQNDSLAGVTLNFVGIVAANTLSGPYTSVAFIKDFVPNYSSSTSAIVPLTPGFFSLTLATAPGDHIQYGFEMVGPDANPLTADSLGSVVVVPEPCSLALLGLGFLGAMVWRRR